MILLGSRILNNKSIIASRLASLVPSVEGAAAFLLDSRQLNDTELSEAIVERLRLDPLEIGRETPALVFQIAYAAPGLETMYLFSRQIHFEGSLLLWKQRPYPGFSTSVRMMFPTAGGVFLQGYCVKADQQSISPYLSARAFGLQMDVNHMRPQIDRYNAALDITVARYIDGNQKETERLRSLASA